MTARQVFEYALIELNKVQAPSLILEDYNYFSNKAINQYINKMYNLYDINQQKSDDLRVLKSSAVLSPKVLPNSYGANALLSKTYEIDLPDDYLHILNCVVEYNVKSAFKCYDAGDKVHFGAKRLTADMFSQIINNYYMRPSYKNPYFYINNVNVDNVFPTSDNQESIQNEYFFILVNSVSLTDTITVTKKDGEVVKLTGVTHYINPSNLASSLASNGIASTATTNEFGDGVQIYRSDVSNISVTGSGLNLMSFPTDKVAQSRYGNQNKVRLEIRYGKDNSLFELSQIYVDYLKSPQYIRLTQSQVDEVEDNSQILEFPDYVCQEIVKELVALLMENASDPRLQSNIPINQSIANPAQEPKR